MRKDLKTGMLLGVVLAVVAVVVISIYSTTVESRLQQETGSAGESNKKNELESEAATEIPPLPVTSQSDPQYPLPTEQADKIMQNTSGNILIHTVAPGETLSAISTLYYGTIDQQQKILDANADIITNADRLRPGMRLIIP
jgi:nucleoid-associated protein YgaU